MWPPLKAALRHFIAPIVKLLLKQGVSHGEFNAEIKSEFVQVAREIIISEGKKPTDSRVATITGLTRKEVKRIREHLDDDSHTDLQQESALKANRCTQVLTGWHRDPDFCDKRTGKPRPITLNEAKHNFPALVKRYSGDMTPRAMLDELLRIKAVEITEDNCVRVLQRNFISGSGTPDNIRVAGTALHDMASTIEFNLGTNSKSARRFQRTAANIDIPVEAIPILKERISKSGQDFLESMDDNLSSYEVSHKSGKKKPRTIRIGVGIYYFQDDDPSQAIDCDDDRRSDKS